MRRILFFICTFLGVLIQNNTAQITAKAVVNENKFTRFSNDTIEIIGINQGVYKEYYFKYGGFIKALKSEKVELIDYPTEFWSKYWFELFGNNGGKRSYPDAP